MLNLTLATNHVAYWTRNPPDLSSIPPAGCGSFLRNCASLQRPGHNFVGIARKSWSFQDRFQRTGGMSAPFALERLVAPEARGEPRRDLRIALVEPEHHISKQPVARSVGC